MVQKKRSKSKQNRIRKRTVSTDDLIALLAKYAAERWTEDATVPGVVVAHLTEDKNDPYSVSPIFSRGVHEVGAVFYVSVTRYGQPNGIEGRKSMASAKHDDLDEAVRNCTKLLLDKYPLQAQKDLITAAKGLPDGEDVHST